MSYGTCIGCLRKTSLNSSAYCSACQVSQSVKNSSKGDSSGDGELFAFMSEITFPLIVLFSYFEKKKWFFLFDLNWLNYLTTFIAASFISRGLRFYLEAYVCWKWGPSMQIIVEKNLRLIMIAGTSLLILGYFIIKYIF